MKCTFVTCLPLVLACAFALSADAAPAYESDLSVGEEYQPLIPDSYFDDATDSLLAGAIDRGHVGTFQMELKNAPGLSNSDLKGLQVRLQKARISEGEKEAMDKMLAQEMRRKSAAYAERPEYYTALEAVEDRMVGLMESKLQENKLSPADIKELQFYAEQQYRRDDVSFHFTHPLLVLH